MTPTDHYAEAEELLRLAGERIEGDTSEAATRVARTYAQMAAAHVQLAQSALLLEIARSVEPPDMDDKMPPRTTLCGWFDMVYPA